jgi:hypothetical protein
MRSAAQVSLTILALALGSWQRYRSRLQQQWQISQHLKMQMDQEENSIPINPRFL